LDLDVKGGTWSEVFESRVIRRIFGPRRDKSDISLEKAP
jgi:hypothetical protein